MHLAKSYVEAILTFQQIL